MTLTAETNQENLFKFGKSIRYGLTTPDQKWAAFSQYERPQFSGLKEIPNFPAFDTDSHGENVMGYAIRVEGYRFVKWYKFNHTSHLQTSAMFGVQNCITIPSQSIFNDENLTWQQMKVWKS